MSIIKCVDFVIQKKQLTILITNDTMTLQKHITSFREGMNIYEQVNFLKRGVDISREKNKQLIKIKVMIL